MSLLRGVWARMKRPGRSMLGPEAVLGWAPGPGEGWRARGQKLYGE